MIFWGIGTYLGRGLSQSVLGDRLGHVKDFSREDPLARAYRNKQEDPGHGKFPPSRPVGMPAGRVCPGGRARNRPSHQGTSLDFWSLSRNTAVWQEP
jgi:hypothetical protein